jgi:hypothetical protein
MVWEPIEQQTVDAVQQATVTRQESAEVLHTDRALHHRFEEVTQGHHDRDRDGRLDAGLAGPDAHQRQDQGPHDERDDRAGGGALDGLVR